MPYRVILTHIDSSPGSIMRSEMSCLIARQQGAHIVGLAPTSLTGSQDASEAKKQHEQDQLVQQNLLRFEQECSALGIDSFESRRVANTPLEAMLWHARFSDLIVMGGVDNNDSSASGNRSITEEVLIRSSRPVLIIPSAANATEEAHLETAIVAWDGSQAAAAAIGNAMPLLASAGKVFVAFVHTSGIEGATELVAGTEVCLYLARHGISAQLVPLEREDTVAATLLDYVEKTQPGVLVMGGYGHSRLRERILGGTTRSVLSDIKSPVLMTH
ncbi:MAG: universal stress protein [Burkholderiaceae bacterium]